MEYQINKNHTITIMIPEIHDINPKTWLKPFQRTNTQSCFGRKQQGIIRIKKCRYVTVYLLRLAAVLDLLGIFLFAVAILFFAVV